MRDHITRLNHRHGICGFASALSAMYEHNNQIRQTIGAIETDQDLLTRTWAEVILYLNTLRAEQSPLLDAIVAFTRTFPGYENHNVETMIESLQNSAREGGFGEQQVGIAMPPEAIVDFLVTRGTDAGLVQQNNEDFDLIFPNVILGLARENGQGNQFNGLVHWVYEQQGIVYDHGEIARLNQESLVRRYRMVYKITI